MTSRKSFWSSRSQTLFFGGREATTGNASAVRRLYRPQTAILSAVLPFKDLSCQRESESKEIIRKKARIGSNVATVTSSCQEGSIVSINVNFMIPTLESGRQWKSLPD